jgi:inorganic pyrophosphatase
MATRKVRSNGLANPSRLSPIDADDKQAIRVIIETPKGSRNKYAFDPQQKIFLIKGEQGKKKKKERNDRIVAVEQENHSYAYVKHIDDLGKKFVRELEAFFVNYHKMLGKTYSIIGVKGPGEARRRVKDGMRANARK